MKDYIKELCIIKKIKPVYMENKLTVLSNGNQNGMPVLRIHKIFKNCPRKTAEAIVNYYFDTGNKTNYIKQIKKHVQKYWGVKEYRIAPICDHFINALILNYYYKEGNINVGSVLAEHPIASLMQKNFNGNYSAKIEDGIISVQDDGMIELDVVVEK